MNRKKITIYGFAAAFFLNTGVSVPVNAADDHGFYQTLHYISCPSYIEDRKEPMNSGQNAVDEIYVSGWLSAYNYLTPNTYGIIPNQNLGMVMLWMDKYCKENPSKSVEGGLLQLTGDLYPDRIKSYTPPPDQNSPSKSSGNAEKNKK